MNRFLNTVMIKHKNITHAKFLLLFKIIIRFCIVVIIMNYLCICNKIKLGILLILKSMKAITNVLTTKKKLLCAVIGILIIIIVITSLGPEEINKIVTSSCCNKINMPMNFTNFDNETGTLDGCYIIPNIVHFIRFSGRPVSYIQMITYLAAFKNQKPDKIYFHYDNESTFSGKYWDIMIKTPGFMDVVVLNYIEMPTEIFGQELNEGWREYHASDVTRLRVLMKYGGIYLDGDSYLVRSVNDFRRYEMAIGWPEDTWIGTQVIMAHKDARFLKEWLESYRGAYDKDQWYYNAGDRPTHDILDKKPYLVHREKYFFGVQSEIIFKIFKENWPQWRNMYTIHVLHRFFYWLGDYEKELPTEFDENNIKNYNITYREMAYDVYNPDN